MDRIVRDSNRCARGGAAWVADLPWGFFKGFALRVNRHFMHRIVRGSQPVRAAGALHR